MKYVVLIPAYNPDEKMVTFLKNLKEHNTDVIIVNDGSKQECEKYFDDARALGYTVLVHGVNKGKGCALKTGFEYVVVNNIDVDYVITADCDGQHAIESIQDVASEGEASGNEAIILGGRFKDDGDKLPLRSNIGNTSTRHIFRMATGLKIHDTQTGLRAIPKSLFKEMIRLKGERYEYEMNMLLKINEWDVPCREISIKTIYIDNNKGSHYSTFKDSVRILSRILIFTLSSFISFVVDYALFIIFTSLLAGKAPGHVAIAYLIGRVVSSILNFTLNSKFVFKQFSWSCVIKYFILCIVVMVLGAAGSHALEDWFGVPDVICKIVIDLPLFFVSYIGQKKFVFKKKVSHK